MYHLGRTPGCSFRYCGNKEHGELSIHATDACVLEQAWVQDGWILTKFAKIAQKKSSLKLPPQKTLPISSYRGQYRVCYMAKVGNPERVRWPYLAHSGANQNTGFASYTVTGYQQRPGPMV